VVTFCHFGTLNFCDQSGSLFCDLTILALGRGILISLFTYLFLRRIFKQRDDFKNTHIQRRKHVFVYLVQWLVTLYMYNRIYHYIFTKVHQRLKYAPLKSRIEYLCEEEDGLKFNKQALFKIWQRQVVVFLFCFCK
jgi:hypothetical protein